MRNRVDRALRLGYEGHARGAGRGREPEPERRTSSQSQSLRGAERRALRGGARTRDQDGVLRSPVRLGPEGSAGRGEPEPGGAQPEPRAASRNPSPSRRPRSRRRRFSRRPSRRWARRTTGLSRAASSAPNGSRWTAGRPDGTIPRMPVSRRRFLQVSGAAAASAALGEAGAFARRPDRPNVLLVIVDSLRADAVYERGVRTPNMDALARLRGCVSPTPFPKRCRPSPRATRS